MKVRKVDPAGIITTVAGSGERGYSGDGGPALAATFQDPVDLALDDVGNLYISDHHNNVVRRLDTAGIITTVAGGGNHGGSQATADPRPRHPSSRGPSRSTTATCTSGTWPTSASGSSSCSGNQATVPPNRITPALIHWRRAYAVVPYAFPNIRVVPPLTGDWPPARPGMCTDTPPSCRVEPGCTCPAPGRRGPPDEPHGAAPVRACATSSAWSPAHDSSRGSWTAACSLSADTGSHRTRAQRGNARDPRGQLSDR